MSARTSSQSRAGGPADLIAWRRKQLMHAGFDQETARALAASGVDLHTTIELVESGCPPELAARIMAPLDHQDPSC